MSEIKSKSIEMVDINAIIPNPKNANRHSIEQIKRLEKLIEYQGFRNPLIVSARTGFLVVGHGRLEAATNLGLTKLPVITQEFKDEAQEYAYLISDNEIARWAELDKHLVYEELKNLDIDDIELLGLEDFEIPGIDVLDPQTDEDEVPEVANPITVRGDVWLLGKHRLMCGDSTSIDDFEKLMSGSKADITFTSPPYNAGKTPKEDGKYANDSDDKSNEDYRDFLNTFTTNCLINSDYVFSNIQSLSGNKTALIDHLYDMKEVYADTMIWDKEVGQPAMAKNVLNSQFEYVHIFSNKANRAVGSKEFRGTISNIFRMNNMSGKEYAKVHKATFRVELPELFLGNFAKNSCLDPFNGTGTTMIACEKLGLNYFGMELDPLYTDITVKRWEEFTGKKAELENGSIQDK
tara:strand:+ start:761 stop:1978 length:1218 start_codon:yes stop_codon:yes gene_type:complete